MAITGTLLVVETGGMRRFEELWLTISLVLYVIALVIVFLAQRPALAKVIELTSGPPAPGRPARGGARPAAQAAAARAACCWSWSSPSWR